MFWVNYNDLIATSLEIMVSKGNYPQMALIQVDKVRPFAVFEHDEEAVTWARQCDFKV